MPVAGCHVLPLSVETSTPATTPPVSEAVPLIVVWVPSATDAGAPVIVDTGLVVSVVLVAARRSVSRVVGWTPMSANRFTVACRMFLSGVLSAGFQSDRPQAHWTVPAPNTSAPLGARYKVMLWVADWPSSTFVA